MSNLPTCGKNGLIYSTAMVMRSETSGFFGTQPRMTQVPWDVGQAGEPSCHCKGDSLTAMKVYGGFRQPLPPSLQLYIHIVISPWHPTNHFLHPKGSSWHPPNHHFLHKGPPRPPAVSLVLTMAKGNSATATCDDMPTQNWVVLVNSSLPGVTTDSITTADGLRGQDIERFALQLSLQTRSAWHMQMMDAHGIS